MVWVFLSAKLLDKQLDFQNELFGRGVGFIFRLPRDFIYADLLVLLFDASQDMIGFAFVCSKFK